MNIQKLPFRNLRRRPVRTGAMVLLVLFLAFSIFSGSVVVTSLRRGLDSLETRLGADIIVVPDSAKSKVNLNTMMVQGVPGYFYMDKSYFDKVSQIDGIEQITAQYYLASVSAGCCSIPVQLVGFDPETDFSIQPWIRQSIAKELGDQDILIGCNIENQPGGTITFYGVDCKVAGQLDETGTELDNAVYANANTIKTLIQASEDLGMNVLTQSDPDTLISSILIKVKDGYSIEGVMNDINVHVRRVQAVQTKQMLSGVAQGLTHVSDIVRLLIAAVWVLALIIMIIAFSMLVNERKKEFAVLRVIGTSRRQLSGIVRKESLWIGLLGGLLGIGVSALFVFPFSGLIEAELGLPFLLPDVAWILKTALATLLVSILAGPITSAFSAYRLSRVDPGTILREGN